MGVAYVSTSEITALEHEGGNHTVELGAFVAKALLTCAQGAEVLGRLGHVLVIELEIDATRLS